MKSSISTLRFIQSLVYRNSFMLTMPKTFIFITQYLICHDQCHAHPPLMEITENIQSVGDPTKRLLSFVSSQNEVNALSFNVNLRTYLLVTEYIHMSNLLLLPDRFLSSIELAHNHIAHDKEMVLITRFEE